MANARRSGHIPGKLAEEEWLGSLLDEKPFAELIASYKSLGGTESAEQVRNFAVLIYVLRSKRARGGNQLQVLRVHNAVAMKRFRLAGVEDRQGDATITNQ